MIAAGGRPVVFAHRGNSAHAPENTLTSFVSAADLGADAIELDTKLTSDGRVIVFHDRTLERTTDGSGAIAGLSSHALRELDAGSHKGIEFRGEKIPYLDEIFEAVGKRVRINVELTNYSTPWDGLVPAVCALVRKHGLEGRILFSSFLATNLHQAQTILPGVPRGLLADVSWRGAWARSFGFAFGSYVALHPFVLDVSARQISRVHRLRRKVNVWTVNDPADMRNLADWGADGIFTDDPALALGVFSATSQ